MNRFYTDCQEQGLKEKSILMKGSDKGNKLLVENDSMLIRNPMAETVTLTRYRKGSIIDLQIKVKIMWSIVSITRSWYIDKLDVCDTDPSFVLLSKM